MFEQIELKGLWWLPDNPSEKVPGILRITPDKKASLDLIGSVKSIKMIKAMGIFTRIILGLSGNSNITLYNCYPRAYYIYESQMADILFDIQMVFKGSHFNKMEEIKFNEIMIDYLNLDKWVGQSGLEFEFSHKNTHEFVVKYKQPDPIEVFINNQFKISIVFGVSYPLGVTPGKGFSIKEKIRIMISPLEKLVIEDYLNIIRLIQIFLSLGLREKIYPFSVTGMDRETDGINEFNKKTEIYYNTIEYPTKSFSPQEIYFSFNDIPSRFDKFLQNWFAKAMLLEEVYNLYYSTIDNYKSNIEEVFLTAIRTIESYHRYTYNNNHHSLGLRLLDIYNKYSIMLDKFIANKEEFIDKIVKTRAYHTHYISKLREKVAKPDEIIVLTKWIKILCEMCLLSEIGFNNEKVNYLAETIILTDLQAKYQR